MWTSTIRNSLLAPASGQVRRLPALSPTHSRLFHDHFITHLPSSSLHPDAKTVVGPRHGLPREKSSPHTSDGSNRTPSAPPTPTTNVGVSRELTVVRIPIRSAKHHFGVSVSRGQRPYNEDSFQVGTIDIPAFAKRRPMSLTRAKAGTASSVTPAGTSSGDPQVFYFGIFDGHGGLECSKFLEEELHKYIEESARLFKLESSLDRKGRREEYEGWSAEQKAELEKSTATSSTIDTGVQECTVDTSEEDVPSDTPVSKMEKIEQLERALILSWRDLVGGYYKRFKPQYFLSSAGGQGHTLDTGASNGPAFQGSMDDPLESDYVGLEAVLTYAFLNADYDFVSAQVGKSKEDVVEADRPLNENDIYYNPSQARKKIGGPKRFKGGSTCSVALISTPTPSPFWNPSSPCTIMTAHCGDTRIILCQTATGHAEPMTTNHHPSVPGEAARLRRYAATFVTDSFGEERVSGLANTRAFGDMASKRIGVSAEPEIRRWNVSPAEYSFMVLVSDGVSGHLSDQEIVDIVKEAKTPEQGARDLVSYAIEVASDADNATALVVRLGGWERRGEGGLGSLGTKELRDWRKQEAENPRGRRQ